MPFVPVPNVVQVNLIWSWLSQECQNVWYYEYAAEPTTEEMQALATELAPLINTNLLGVFSDTCSLTTIRVRNLTSEFAPGLDSVVGLPVVGDVAGNSMPTEVAACVSHLTALRGRSFRGRSYLPGLSETYVNGNTLDSGYRTQVVTGMGIIMAAIADGGPDMVVVSRIEDGAPRVTGVTTPITSFRCDAVPDSQRRRKPGYGN